MSGIRRVSDLGSKGVSSILDGSIQAADFAEGIITGSGHSNIFSNSLSSSTATVVSATRTYQNKQYFFSNLTFNMPSNANTDASDWTAPANSSTYKWSYIYIRPTDNKFFISNNSPSAGQNYRTIGGNLCLYLFPAYTSSTILFQFQLSDTEYTIQQLSGQVVSFTPELGLTLIYERFSVSSAGNPTNVNTLIPSTAGNVYVGFRYSQIARDDGGATHAFSASAEIKNKSGTWIAVHKENGWRHFKTPTPTSNTFFLTMVSHPVELTLSRNLYDFTAVQVKWAYEGSSGGDGNTGAGLWLKGFSDANIF